MRRTKRTLAAAVVLVLMSTLLAGCDMGSDAGYLRSNLHTYNWRVARDGGWSADMGNGQALWMFGDTGLWNPQGQGQARNNTFARGPFTVGQTPTGLGEIGPYGVPDQLIPDPSPSLVPCPAARPNRSPWPSGGARIPGTNRVLISYVTMCTSGQEFTPAAFGFVELDTTTNQITRNVPNVWASPTLHERLALGFPVFDGNYLYLFKGHCQDGCQLNVARVSLSSGYASASPRPWETNTNIHWRTASSWGAGHSAAANVGPSGLIMLGASMMRQSGVTGGPWVLLEQVGLEGKTRIWTSASPTGTWTKRGEGTLGCTAGQRCYAVHGHAFLGTGNTIMVSYYQGGPNLAPASATEHQIRMRKITLS